MHLVALIALVDVALGAVGIGRGDRGAHVLEPDAVARELVGLELDPHRGQGAAAELDLTHAGDLRELLLDDGVGRIVELRRGERARGQRQNDDRRVGRVVFAVSSGCCAASSADRRAPPEWPPPRRARRR